MEKYLYIANKELVFLMEDFINSQSTLRAGSTKFVLQTEPKNLFPSKKNLKNRRFLLSSHNAQDRAQLY